MTDQSKYARAIEAIRTQHFYHREWADAIKHIEEMPWGPMDLEGAIRAFKYNFSNWCWHVGETGEGSNYARIFMPQSDKIVVHDYQSKAGDIAPSPAKSLLIVMLMALEEMDKKEAQS